MQAQRATHISGPEGTPQQPPSSPAARSHSEAMPADMKPFAEKSDTLVALSSRATPSPTTSPEGSKSVSPSTLATTPPTVSGPSAAASPAPYLKPAPSVFRRTRIFVISDTHGLQFSPPKGHFDFVVCLGDHTDRSTKQEFEQFIGEIVRIDADHIFIIFGNHEFSTDPLVPKAKYPKFPGTSLQPRENYLTRDHALQLCRDHGIILLDEGRQTFHLKNGTTAKIYASSYTPRRTKSPCNGYRYKRRDQDDQFGHDFNMGPGIDLVLTHEPPEGVLDDCGTSPSRRGCRDLLEAVASAKPRLHCFGHNHAAWGATFVDWESGTGDEPFLEDRLAKQCDEKLKMTKATKIELVKHKDLASLRHKDARRSDPIGCYRLSHCSEDPHPIKTASTTLFVNAAYKGIDSDSEGETETHMPMIVDLELPLTVKPTVEEGGLPAAMKKSPKKESKLVSRGTFVSGRPGSWTPPHKRQNSTGQKASAAQAASASDPPVGKPETPVQSSLSVSEEPPGESVANGSEGESQGERQSRSRSTSKTSQCSLSVTVEMVWGVRSTAKHHYRPIGDGRASSSDDCPKSSSPKSLFTSPSRLGSEPQSPSHSPKYQAISNRSKLTDTSPECVQRTEAQPSAASANQLAWRNNKAGDGDQAKRESGSSRAARKAGKRGAYEFSKDKAESSRNTEGSWL